LGFTKKILIIVLLIIVAVGTAWAFYFYYKNLRGIGPALNPPPGDITELVNDQDSLLQLPKNFSISIFAEGLPGIRVMAFDALGNMWVSQTTEGTVSLIEVQDGKATKINPILKDLNNPHGLAFDPQNEFVLYIAEED